MTMTHDSVQADSAPERSAESARVTGIGRSGQRDERGQRDRRRLQAWIVALAALGQFMTALDTLVVTTSLPALRAALHTSVQGLEWTVNAYNLAFACCLLTGAALGDRFGRRRMYVAGLLLFSLASAGAALAPGIGVLVAARTVQGAAAAMVMPLTLTLISEAFPPEKRGVAIGICGGIGGLGIAAGPVVGGAIVTELSWHWIFWLNVPVGAVVAILTARRLPESFGPRPRLDLPGLALAGLGLLGVTWALVRTATLGWESAEVCATLAGGLALIGVFLAWERVAKIPMITLALFRNRDFSAASAVCLLMYGGLFGALFLVSQFLQDGLGETPLAAGVRLLPWAGPSMVVMPAAGVLAARFGNRAVMATGLILQAAGLAWLASVAAIGMPYWVIGTSLAVTGVGTCLCIPPATSTALGSVPLAEAGIASGANSAIREVGGVLGVAVLASVFARHGGYASPDEFAAGFKDAIWAAVAFSVVGVAAALVTRKDTVEPRREAGIS
jgi:EmrB/QacA subfamily drug resistance transporter